MKRAAVIPVVTALSIAIGTVLFLGFGEESEISSPTLPLANRAPLYSDAFMWGGPCAPEPGNRDPSRLNCARGKESPNGRLRFVLDGYRIVDGNDSYRVYVMDRVGEREYDLPELANGFPFAMEWSPRPNWFFVDQHQGSGMQAVRVFEIFADGAREHTEFYDPAQDAYAEHFPCLRNPENEWANGNVQGWSRDGRYLAWLMMAHSQACRGDRQYGPLRPEQEISPAFLISDLDTGEIVDGSFRVVPWDGMQMPTDGPYAQIVRPGE